MTPQEPLIPGDPLVELRYALAEADAVDGPPDLRSRVMAAAASARRPGAPSVPPAHISGAEAFARAVARFDALLGDLAPDEWSRPALRDLDVQGLVGHLIGVEEAFAVALAGHDDPLGEPGHVEGTQAAARRQAGRSPRETRREWSDRAGGSVDALAGLDLAAVFAFYGVALSLDDVLVVRAFELWIHDEDIRRATGRPLAGPDPERLARMVRLAATLLPTGVAIAGRSRPGPSARLVLLGAGGGTWDLRLDGSAEPGPTEARIVIDATQFCRIVGNRQNATGAGAIVDGDLEVAADLLVGAAALALD